MTTAQRKRIERLRDRAQYLGRELNRENAALGKARRERVRLKALPNPPDAELAEVTAEVNRRRERAEDLATARRRALKALADAREKYGAQRITTAGVSLVKTQEGWYPRPYLDPVGIWTVGFGHTGNVPGRGIWVPGQNRRGVLTPAEGDQLLRLDLSEFEAGVKRLVRRPMTAGEFSAFVSLAFNIGLGAFASSTVLRKFNQGDKRGAAAAFLMWIYGDPRRPPLPGLVIRRKREIQLFKTGRWS